MRRSGRSPMNPHPPHPPHPFTCFVVRARCPLYEAGPHAGCLLFVFALPAFFLFCFCLCFGDVVPLLLDRNARPRAGGREGEVHTDKHTNNKQTQTNKQTNKQTDTFLFSLPISFFPTERHKTAARKRHRCTCPIGALLSFRWRQWEKTGQILDSQLPPIAPYPSQNSISCPLPRRFSLRF